MRKWPQVQSINELVVGELYEVQAYTVGSLVPWFLCEDWMIPCGRPENGSHVVYMGTGVRHDPFYSEDVTTYLFLWAADAKMYYVESIEVIKGLKRAEL